MFRPARTGRVRVTTFGFLARFGFSQNFEYKPACDGGGFGELHFYFATKAVGPAALCPNESFALFVKDKIFMAETARSDQSVRARFVQGNEQPEFRNAGNARLKCRADAVFEEGGDIAVFGITLCGRGAALCPCLLYTSPSPRDS